MLIADVHSSTITSSRERFGRHADMRAPLLCLVPPADMRARLLCRAILYSSLNRTESLRVGTLLRLGGLVAAAVAAAPSTSQVTHTYTHTHTHTHTSAVGGAAY
jgi:hypothetical protein